MINTFCYQTPIGKILIADNGKAITCVSYSSEQVIPGAKITETALIKRAAQQLKEYFAGARKTFDLPLEPQGTPFQLKVWAALLAIPYGETKSYKQIALASGNVKACRAVGMANNKNPIAIVIPCHRVIGADGKMVGYAGGISAKEYLLNLEKQK